ncbi:MAG: GGDEF domain-containing protein [Planctomycetes bacterium]|nr:GGDEF domain-containing protein [Planctomycetota bacterium]
MGTDDSDESTEAFEAQTAKYDLGWLQKAQLEKKTPILYVLRGADAGLRIPLTKESLTLGRTIEADLVFHDEQISRRHARISLDSSSGAYFLEDLSSTNGTFLNDRPVTKGQLKDGDKIFLGTTILKFSLEDDVDMESGEIFDRLVFQDDLTGLVVKRRFYNELKVQLHYAGVQSRPVSVLMMDMDGLKKVNDTHGHPMGAYVISEVGKLIGGICGQSGQACRYGGDEFVAYLVGAGKDEAVTVGEAIRKAVKEAVFSKDGVEVRVSISIGVATFPDSGRTLDAITKAADEALYRAKAKGRDVVSE